MMNRFIFMFLLLGIVFIGCSCGEAVPASSHDKTTLVEQLDQKKINLENFGSIQVQDAISIQISEELEKDIKYRELSTFDRYLVLDYPEFSVSIEEQNLQNALEKNNNDLMISKFQVAIKEDYMPILKSFIQDHAAEGSYEIQNLQLDRVSIINNCHLVIDFSYNVDNTQNKGDVIGSYSFLFGYFDKEYQWKMGTGSLTKRILK